MDMNIEQMIADGVSQKLIDLASINKTIRTFKIGRRLENPILFYQFMIYGEISEDYWKYAYAAGLISKADAELLEKYTERYSPA